MDVIEELIAEIARLECNIELYRLTKTGGDPSKSNSSRVFSEAELTDWREFVSAGVLYRLPRDGEDQTTLARTYLRLLDAYAERWVYKKAEPQRTAPKRWWRKTA